MASGVIINELPKWIVFGLWFLLNIALFIYQFHLFQTAPGHFYIRYYIREALAFARGPSLPINFNVILILLPVCRNILSVIRGCTRVVPRSIRRLLDKNLTFHKAIAWMLIVSSAMHVMAHYYNYERLSRYAPPDNLPPGEQANPPLGAIPPALQANTRFNPIQVCFITYAGVTGHIITLALFLMVTSSLEFIRRSYFEVFWYTHHLFLVFLVGLGIHQYGRLLPVLRNPGVLTDNGTPLEFCAYRKGDNVTLCEQLSFIPAGPTSWLYLLCGLLIYGLERLLRLVRSLYSVVIIKVVQHPNKTFEIQMRRKGFHADAGQYVFINCPAVAWFEWHPFTLTSAPEEDYFSVHIRIVGDWTNGVADKLGVFRDDFQQSWELPNIYVDGPFGTASEDVFDHSVGLLVGAGIGVTPFASVLKSIYYRLSEEGQRLHLKKVYFVWICPETNSFEWFAELFSELEHQLHERGIDDFLTSWIYLTRGWKENQAYYLMLNEGQRVQDGDQVDAITGLKAQTIFGRPEWEKIFENVSLAHPNTDVGVFFCGPSVLSHNLHKYCNEFTKKGGDTGARFYYNKENF